MGKDGLWLGKSILSVCRDSSKFTTILKTKYKLGGLVKKKKT